MEKKSSGVTIPRWGIGVIAGVGVLLVLLLIVLIPRGGIGWFRCFCWD